MGSFIFASWIILVFSSLLPQNDSTSVENCPSNCICYPDILSNLATWEWIESDIHSNPNDPEDKQFNPYTQHNEVYAVPGSVNSQRNDDTLYTVTCILRTDNPVKISEMFSQIPKNTQVLSILQGAGSGNITLNRVHLELLTDLIGIDVQGYKDPTTDFPRRPSSFRLAADALLPLTKLTYLSLDNVLLHQRSLEPPPEEYTSRIVSLRKPGTHYNSTYEGKEVLSNLESQLIFIFPKDSSSKEPIVPYNVYKDRASSTINEKDTDLKAKPPEPKLAVAFTGIPSLLHLRISGCNMHDITWDMFHQLQSLKFLLLERNDLLFLPDFVFYATSNLTTLSLSGNRILSLETVGLAGLLYLRKLDMTHNNITHLSELSLPPFPHLEVADFRYNPIEAIFPNTFEVMNTTKSLYLGSPLVSLQIFPNSFFGLANLINLEITNIRIEILERQMFRDLSNLKSLVMDGQVKKISYDAFIEMPKLEKLKLRNCHIEKISMDAFIGLKALVELDLSHNRITFLSPAIFDDQDSLREIYLKNNQLTTLPPNLFAKTPVKMIRLEGNPWHCSCDMKNWNPGKINQVRSFYLQSGNETQSTHRQYCKGHVCQRDHLRFAVKYIYEKRVSPICVTPKKFSQRNVFDVMRKELQYCSASVPIPNISATVAKSKSKFGKALKLLKSQEQKGQGTMVEKMKKTSKERVTAVSINVANKVLPSPSPTASTTNESDTTIATPLATESTTMQARTTSLTELASPQIATPQLEMEDNGITMIPSAFLSIPAESERRRRLSWGTLLSPKVKGGGTPPPLKLTMRDELTLLNQRPMKKALKLSKLHRVENRLTAK